MDKEERLTIQRKSVEVALEELGLDPIEYTGALIYFIGKIAEKFERDELKEFTKSSEEARFMFDTIIYLKKKLREMMNEAQIDGGL